MSIEEAWEIINSKKTDSNHYGMFFNLTKDLPEGFKKSLEDKLVNMVIMGSTMGEALYNTKKGSPEYNQMAGKLSEIAQKTKFQIEEEFKKSQEASKQREKDDK